MDPCHPNPPPPVNYIFRGSRPGVCLSEFKKTLEEAIRSDTSGHFQRLLISLSQVPSSQQDGEEKGVHQSTGR